MDEGKLTGGPVRPERQVSEEQRRAEQDRGGGSDKPTEPAGAAWIAPLPDGRGSPAGGAVGDWAAALGAFPLAREAVQDVAAGLAQKVGLGGNRCHTSHPPMVYSPITARRS